MKKIILIGLIFILSLSSCSTSNYEEASRPFKVYDENLYEQLLQEVEGVKLPKFTKEEKKAIKYYRENGLNVGQYEYEHYYSKLDNETVGVNYYIMLLIETFFNIKTNVINIDFEDVNEVLKDGTVDIVPGVYKTTITDDALKVSKSYSYDKIYVYSTKYTNLQSVYDLEGLSIGLLDHSTYISDADEKLLSEQGISVDIKRYDTLQDTIDSYNNNEIDGIIYSVSKELMQKGFILDEIDTNMFSKKLKFGYNPNNMDEHFISALDKFFELYEIKENVKNVDRLQYQIFLSKGLFFTEEEKRVIEKTKTNPIIFENINFIKPIIYYDETTNNYEGAVSEVWRRVSHVSGLQYKNLEYNDKPFYKTLENVQNGVIDGSMLKILNKNDTAFVHTRPFFKARYVLVGSKTSPKLQSVHDLDTYSVGVVKSTSASKYLYKHYSPENIVDDFDILEDVIEALKNQEVDYIILNDFIYNDLYYKNQDYELTHIANFDYEGDFISFFNKDNVDNKHIVSIFNKSLPGIELLEIENTYLNTKVNIGMLIDDLETRNYIIYFTTTIIVFAITLLFLESIRKNIEIKKISKTDSLTKTNNRYSLSEDFSNGFTKNQTIFYIDLDNFKPINDTYGHLTGDLILKEYVKEIKQINNSKLYRFGGDEFILVITDAHLSDDKLMENIKRCSKVEITDTINDMIHNIEASVGIVNLKILGQDTIEQSYALDLADFTMYLAKKDTTLKFKICDEDVIKKQKNMHAIEDKMNSPLEDVGVIPYFQPIFDLYENKIVGFEALARWKSDNDFIYPDEFIPIIEKMGSIHILDLYIFDKSLAKMEQWLNDGIVDTTMYIASNFSPLTLANITIKDIDNIFNKYTVSKENFVIEITETFFAEENAISLVLQLKEKGYKIAIDDFSAGHSSINSLIQTNMDVTKIDKALVGKDQHIKHDLDDKNTIALKNIIKLISELKSDIIIEGVETKEVIDLLKKIGTIKKVQGYYYSKPLDEKSIEDLILKINKSNYK